MRRVRNSHILRLLVLALLLTLFSYLSRNNVHAETQALAAPQSNSTALSDPAIKIHTDLPTAGHAVSGDVSIEGWAIHLQATTNTGIDQVHIYLDGLAGAGGTFLGSAQYGRIRGDVADEYGPQYERSGFLYEWDTTTIAPGSHTLYIYARKAGTEIWSYATHSVIVTSVGIEMRIDVPTENATVSGSVTIEGWAIHRAAPTGTGVEFVHIYLDGQAGAGGTFLGAAQYGISRQDIADKYGNARYRYSGYLFRWTPTSNLVGEHVLYVYARSTVNGLSYATVKVFIVPPSPTPLPTLTHTPTASPTPTNTPTATPTSPPTNPPTPTLVPPTGRRTNFDFNGDGRADILWRNMATGENAMYLMNGGTIQRNLPINVVPDMRWQIVGVADMSGDGKADILLRNMVTGDNLLYRMDGNIIRGKVLINTVADLRWQIVGVGDLTGDGKPDIVLRNMVTGDNVLYRMDGHIIRAKSHINTLPDMNWKVIAIVDMTGDGKADILLRNRSTGDNLLYEMDGARILRQTLINTLADMRWQIVGVADFNGDNKPDIVLRNTVTGDNVLYQMDGPRIHRKLLINTLADLRWKVVSVADFTGDGKADILLRNTATGDNVLYRMDGHIIRGKAPVNTESNLQWTVIGFDYLTYVAGASTSARAGAPQEAMPGELDTNTSGELPNEADAGRQVELPGDANTGREVELP